MFVRASVILAVAVFYLNSMSMAFAASLQIGHFQVNVTPPVGSPLCDGLVPPVASVDDPLFARGIILLGAGEPIVLCAVDYVGIGNGGHDQWREVIAKSAGTSVSRVAVHTLHQHDAPGCDFEAEEQMVAMGQIRQATDIPFQRDVLRRLEVSIRNAVSSAQPLTHVGVGRAKVDRVASNRRILGADGKVKIVRFSSTKDAEAIAAPEGTIDPELKAISFWNGDTRLISMTYYATHPQSYYGKGAVSADFVGLARAERDRAEPGVFHIHFNGAGGNIAAGKYNDGSHEARVQLTERLAAGMKTATDNTSKSEITAADVEWRVQPVLLPLSERLQNLEPIEQILQDEKQVIRERCRAARDLAYARRVKSGKPIELSALHIGSAVLLHLPGEIFIEYQLAAQSMRLDRTILTAGYGDYGPGYIGTTASYPQGGYETSLVSRTAPEVEGVLIPAIRTLVK